MKYTDAWSQYGAARLELTRRNLEALLAKLDDPASERTLIDGDNRIIVKAVEDDAHYHDRAPGETAMPTAGITRVDVVIPGVVKEYWADSWKTYIQDEGRTLKLIAEGDGTAHKAERDLALAGFIVANHDRIVESVLRGKAQLASGDALTLDEVDEGASGE